MKTYATIILIALTFAPLAANAQAGGCGDPRAQNCNPGQYLDTSTDQDICRACTGNTFSNGCTRSCSACGSGTVPTSDHSSCMVPDGCGDPRAQNCNPGQYLNTNGNQDACINCPAGAVANGCTRSCTTCGPGKVPDSYHGSCVECGAGKIPNSSHSDCSDCGAGTIANAGHTSCSACSSNEISNSDHTSCSKCSSGTVPNSDHTSCSSCGAGLVPNSDNSSCVPTPVAWSPHSKPFDLVWDMNEEDYNGLPWNPLWAWQLDNSGVPDFASICGPAISGGDSINANLLHQICTSQSVTLSTHWTLGAYCSGLINGHLTWSVASQTGLMSYADWSGNYHWYDWDDGDYGLNFLDGPDLFPFPLGKGNPPAKCDGSNCGMTSNESSLGLEFNDSETIDNAGDPWWQQMVNQVENGNGASNPTVSQFLTGKTFYPGVVVGMIGIDGVHGGYAESHPVFAIALKVADSGVVDNKLTEDWVFFLTNKGSGGGCSDTEWHWQTANNTYYIQLPGHPDATSMDIKGLNNVGFPAVWGWGGSNIISMPRSADKAWTLMKIQNSAYPFGVDGEFTLTYTFPAGKSNQKKRATPPTLPGEKEKEDSFNVNDVASRITDPAVKAKFLADVQAAAKAFTNPPPGAKRVQVQVDTTAKIEPRTPGAASRGEITQPTKVAGSVEEQRSDATKKLADTYRTKIPATAPPK